MRNVLKKLTLSAVLTGAVAGGSAMAAGYADIGAGISTTDVVAGLLAFGAIYVGPGFAKWATKKVAGFFG
ncbi:hypothetical protein [Xanthomonas sp. NCPPB 2632]|uniref:hypothetical protein n=1 Tax=Xanthomonas sp. NCPPB 2632 TaxID=3240912 RepID=UPI0035142C04